MSSPVRKAYQDRLDSGELTPDVQQDKAVQALSALYETILKRSKRSFISKLIKPNKDKTGDQGIYMYGGVGRGKSMLMDMFAGVLPKAIKTRRIHFHEFMIETHNYLHERRSAGDIGAQRMESVLPTYAKTIAKSVQVLCFDEFHVTDVADAMILGRLFTALYEEGVYIVSTSNWAPDDLYKDGLQRELFLPFIKTLKSEMTVVHLDSPTDYREQTGAQDIEKYITPVNDLTEDKMRKAFAALPDPQIENPPAIHVKGRDITPVMATKNVAWFTFAQLCEQPMGAEDYLSIARGYKTVFLQGVRKMAYDRRNEAKRFMALIDALYDEGTQLMIQAQTQPEKLYRGHDHAFEFERTISRLKEMTALSD